MSRPIMITERPYATSSRAVFGEATLHGVMDRYPEAGFAMTNTTSSRAVFGEAIAVP